VAVALLTAAFGAPAAAQAPPPSMTVAVATSYNDVRVQFNEPLDPASVQPGDFALQMAASNRVVDGAAVTGDGSVVMLHSPTTWIAGQAGMTNLVAPGVVSSAGGVPSASTDPVHVGGAPGDFTPPVLSRFSVRPAAGVCFVPTRNCRRTGTAISFLSSEDGFYFLTVFRGAANLGSVKHITRPGDNFVRFDGKVRGRLLQPGRYRIVLSAIDNVGNVTPLQGDPSRTLTVKRR
jgi:hypothetical protein